MSNIFSTAKPARFTSADASLAHDMGVSLDDPAALRERLRLSDALNEAQGVIIARQASTIEDLRRALFSHRQKEANRDGIWRFVGLVEAAAILTVLVLWWVA